jgi:hypothetical protein
MSEDRPLTDFVGDDADSDGGSAAAVDANSSDKQTAVGGSDAAPNTDDTEPATATYRWQPDGATCADCGSRTDRGWRDDDAFVCPDCKSW